MPRSARWIPLLRLVFIGVYTVVISVIVVEVWGLPALRWEYEYSGTWSSKTFHSCRYLTLTGFKDVMPGEVGYNCPFVTFIPLEYSLWHYAWNGLREAFA